MLGVQALGATPRGPSPQLSLGASTTLPGLLTPSRPLGLWPPNLPTAAVSPSGPARLGRRNALTSSRRAPAWRGWSAARPGLRRMFFCPRVGSASQPSLPARKPTAAPPTTGIPDSHAPGTRALARAHTHTLTPTRVALVLRSPTDAHMSPHTSRLARNRLNHPATHLPRNFLERAPVSAPDFLQKQPPTPAPVCLPPLHYRRELSPLSHDLSHTNPHWLPSAYSMTTTPFKLSH